MASVGRKEMMTCSPGVSCRAKLPLSPLEIRAKMRVLARLATTSIVLPPYSESTIVAVAVVRSDTGFERGLLASVKVTFRDLGDAEIEHYLRTEQPYDCAGSAKCETLGIALLSAIESDDPTALIGLPLIRTCELLRQAGIDPLRSLAS